MECLKQAEPDDGAFDAEFKLLIETVLHHMREEEHQLFPRAMEILGEDLRRLGIEMKDYREQHVDRPVAVGIPAF